MNRWECSWFPSHHAVSLDIVVDIIFYHMCCCPLLWIKETSCPPPCGLVLVGLWSKSHTHLAGASIGLVIQWIVWGWESIEELDGPSILRSASDIDTNLWAVQPKAQDDIPYGSYHSGCLRHTTNKSSSQFASVLHLPVFIVRHILCVCPMRQFH